MHKQQLVVFVRIAFTLMLAIGVLSIATGESVSSPALGKDKHGHHGHSHKPDKDKKHDAKQDKKDNGKGNGKKDKKDKRVRAELIAQYTVRVDCDFDASTDETTCLFDADSPPGAKKINLFDVPAEEVCAPVVGGDARYVDPDPNTQVTGYRSTDSDGHLTLVFSGEVAVAGSATYWIKAASNVFPATGPGLQCASFNASSAEPTADASAVRTPTPPAQLTPEVTDTTGSVIVRSHVCPIASPPAEYDWYGQCSAQGSGVRYRLVRVDTETRDGLTTSTDATGRAQFLSLQPGVYELTQADGDWCHAQSDNVDADGNLIVNAGERTTVWVFACTDNT